jgi:PAS domain S-box-containing protein
MATWLLRSVLAWAAYVAVGLLALELAVPPSYASPLYPPAGIALAAVLAWGRPMLPAVALAAATVNVTLSGARQFDDWVQVGVPLAIGAGAALQAWAAGALVRRFVAQPLALDEPRDIARFLLLAGPVSCTLSAAVAVGALTASGALPPHGVLQAALTWWGGDTMGVLIAAPIVLALIGQPHEVWRERRTSVALPMIGVVLIAALAIAQAARWERARLVANFERAATEAAHSITHRLQDNLDALETAHAVFVASGDVNRTEFRRALAPWLGRLPWIQAIGWHERVSRERVAQFEASVRAEGVGEFRVFDRAQSETPGDEVVAMRYVEPMATNASALGVNVLSIPAARAAVERARREGVPIATQGFRLTQEQAEQNGVVIYRAVVNGDPRSPAQRVQATRGLVFVTLRMGDVLEALRRNVPAHLDLCLSDTSEAAQPQPLAGSRGCTEVPAGSDHLTHEAPIEFAGRQWLVRIGADARSPAMGATWNAWIFSVVGLLASAALGALLLLMSGRARRVQQLVHERTTDLEQEVQVRARAEALLQDSERRWRQMFETAPIGVVLTGADRAIRDVNPAFVALTGYTRAELLGRHVADFARPDEQRGMPAEPQGDAAHGGSSEAGRIKRYARKDGSVRWVRLRVRALGDAPDGEAGTVAVLEDLTEHVRLRSSERAREAAESANRAKTEFVSRMSHELRTPLNAMLGFAQLLELDRLSPLSDAQRQWARQIQQAGWHLLDMINDTLDLSRIESGTLSLSPQVLELDAVLHAVQAMMAPAAAERSVRIDIEPTPGPLRVRGDEKRLRQILINLLSNAVKYNVSGGTVMVAAAHAPGDVAEVSVTDTGPGMSEAQIAQLFQPFNRLGREQSTVEGTGIGLVISQRLAHLMGGQLRAHSAPGRGTTFVLSLPLMTGEATPAGPMPARRRVLYIEDNPINVEVMHGMLAQRTDIDLETAATAAAGLRAAHARRPDLVLLDMHLPDMDGLDVLRRFKLDPEMADVPVVAVSADATGQRVDAALHGGAVRYLTKPVDANDLLLTVDALLPSFAASSVAARLDSGMIAPAAIGSP